MSDQNRPQDQPDLALDNQLRRLVGNATSDTPPAPPIESFTEIAPKPQPHQVDLSRRRWIVAGATGITAAATVVLFIVFAPGQPEDSRLRTIPSITIEHTNPSTTAPSGAGPTTGLPATTSVEATPESELKFTPLLLEPSVQGYTLDYAVSIGGSSDLGLVRYLDDSSDSPSLELIIRDAPDSFLDRVRELDRQTWDVDGRTVYDDNQGEGCLPNYCSVGLQWDENTNVSVTWTARPGTVLGPENDMESLVEHAAALHAAAASTFRPTVSAIGPTISKQGVLVAGPDGVIAFDGWAPDPLVLTTMPAFKATGLPDGRVLIQNDFSVAADGMFVFDPSADDNAELEPYWPSPIPNDASTSIDIEDAATIGGVPTLLMEVTSGGTRSLELAAIDGSDVERRVIAEFPRGVGENSDGLLNVDLRDTKSIPAIAGILYELSGPTPIFLSLDGERSTDAEESLLATAPVLSVGLDTDSYLVAQLDEGPIMILDQTGDQHREITLDNSLFPNQRGSLRIEPTLQRTIPVTGSVWLKLQTLDGLGVWIEVGVDGEERNRVAGTRLTATNR